MRSALLFTTILLFAIVPFSNPAAAGEFSTPDGYTITVSFDNSTEMTTLNITMPVTNNATKLDVIKDANFIIRGERYDGDGQYMEDILIGTYQFCTQDFSNSECSGAHFEIEYYPTLSGQMSYRLLINHPTIQQGIPTIMALSALISQNVSPVLAVENLTGMYSEDVTTLSWDYPESIAMNHSIMIYSHDSPATRENWNSLTKTIVSSSVAAGTTNFAINHSSYQVERDIYYSVTLLYETSEDTRFIGSNSLTEPVREDNTPPSFVGELTATFDSELEKTTIDWGAGVVDDDLMINIYRSQMEMLMLDTNNLVATVDSSLSSYEEIIPMGEHRQSWYAITLVDSQGNENLELSESSPAAEPIIESTISSSQISNIGSERHADGTITITWDDTSQSSDAVAKIWRSITGPIDTFQNLEELTSINASLEQFSHNPPNPADQVWYAITIEGTWGSGSIPWHDDRLTSGVNSLTQSVRETEEITEEPAIQILAHVQSTAGTGGDLVDGDLMSLGSMYEGDLIIISTSKAVENISCHDIAGQGSVIYSQSDWSLSFSANQSGEACYGMIIDGEDEIGFTITWNYIENITVVDDNEQDDKNKQPVQEDEGSKNSKDTIAGVILAIIILILLVYLLVMMKAPEYTEEE